MRVLLDECLPRRLKFEFTGHQVMTTQELGLSGKKNGELLRAAAGKIDALLTVDKNLAYQQNLKSLPFAVVVMSSRSNRLGDLIPVVPSVLAVLRSIKPGELVKVGV